jgi:hypothetical protein
VSSWSKQVLASSAQVYQNFIEIFFYKQGIINFLFFIVLKTKKIPTFTGNKNDIQTLYN